VAGDVDAHIKARAFLGGGSGAGFNDFARGRIHEAPVNAHVGGRLFEPEVAQAARDKAAQADLCLLVSKARHLGGEHKIRRRKTSFFHLLVLLHPAILAQLDLIHQRAELGAFKHLELVEFAHFGDEHFAEALAQSWLPVLNGRGVTAERGDDQGRQRVLRGQSISGNSRRQHRMV